MPLPLFLGIGAAIAAATGVGVGVRGGVKMKKANDTIKSAKDRQDKNIEKFEIENKVTIESMDRLGKYELEILKSFKEFSDVFEKIKNRPDFKEISIGEVKLPEYSAEQIKKVSIGAGALLGGLGGAGLGVAGGFAASGATTAAVMAVGTASTGTAISTLSGAALTNATLAALGGGAIAAGGGGVALGTTILGAASLGVSLLVGGIIFSVTGSKIADKADKAMEVARETEKKIARICEYLIRLRTVANDYSVSLNSVNSLYKRHLNNLKRIVNEYDHKDWEMFTPEEKVLTENTVLLVGLLYNMCKVQIVIKGKKDDDLNEINSTDINMAQYDAECVLNKVMLKNL